MKFIFEADLDNTLLPTTVVGLGNMLVALGEHMQHANPNESVIEVSLRGGNDDGVVLEGGPTPDGTDDRFWRMRVSPEAFDTIQRIDQSAVAHESSIQVLS